MNKLAVSSKFHSLVLPECSIDPEIKWRTLAPALRSVLRHELSRMIELLTI